MEPQYMTADEVAKRLRVTPQTVNRWCRLGFLKAIRAGKKWRIAPADLDVFTDQQRRQEATKKANGLAAFASN